MGHWSWHRGLNCLKDQRGPGAVLPDPGPSSIFSMWLPGDMWSSPCAGQVPQLIVRLAIGSVPSTQ